MSTCKCSYCDNRFAPESAFDFTCLSCKKVVEKLDEDTTDWLIKVIDAKIDKALSSHTDRYNHESSGYFY